MWGPDLDFVCNVVQIGAFNGQIRAFSMSSHFCSYGPNFARFGVEMPWFGCAARTVREIPHDS